MRDFNFGLLCVEHFARPCALPLPTAQPPAGRPRGVPGVSAAGALSSSSAVIPGLPNGSTKLRRAASTPSYSVLHSFGGSGDGAEPTGDLVIDSDRNIYGVTSARTASNAGTVFKITASTGKEAVLYAFTGGTDSSLPMGGLVTDTGMENLQCDESGGRFGARRAVLGLARRFRKGSLELHRRCRRQLSTSPVSSFLISSLRPNISSARQVSAVRTTIATVFKLSA